MATSRSERRIIKGINYNCEAYEARNGSRAQVHSRGRLYTIGLRVMLVPKRKGA